MRRQWKGKSAWWSSRVGKLCVVVSPVNERADNQSTIRSRTRRGRRRQHRRDIADGQGEREHCGLGGPLVTRRKTAIIGWGVLVVTPMIVLSDVEMKVECSGAYLPVTVPFSSRKDPEAGGADRGHQDQARGNQPYEPNNVSTNESHLGALC